MRLPDIIDINDPAGRFYGEASQIIRSTRDAYLGLDDFAGAARFGRDAIAMLDEMCGDSLGVSWRRAVRSQFRNPRAATEWKARALNLDASDPHMAIALACFAPMKWDETWMLAVPLPLPRPMGPKFAEPDDILLINPATGQAKLYSTDTNILIGADKPDSFTVMADAKVWAREIAATAVEWLYRCVDAAKMANITPVWGGSPPSALAIGDQAKIIWPHVTAITAGAGVDAAKLKKTIFRQARITHVESPMQIARAA